MENILNICYEKWKPQMNADVLSQGAVREQAAYPPGTAIKTKEQADQPVQVQGIHICLSFIYKIEMPCSECRA